MSRTPFTRDFTAPEPPGPLSQSLVQSLTPALETLRYQVVSQGQDGITLHRQYRPWWLWVLIVGFFPIGLLLLLAPRSIDIITFGFEREGDETRVLIAGTDAAARKMFDGLGSAE